MLRDSELPQRFSELGTVLFSWERQFPLQIVKCPQAVCAGAAQYYMDMVGHQLESVDGNPKLDGK